MLRLPGKFISILPILSQSFTFVLEILKSTVRKNDNAITLFGNIEMSVKRKEESEIGNVLCDIGVREAAQKFLH